MWRRDVSHANLAENTLGHVDDLRDVVGDIGRATGRCSNRGCRGAGLGHRGRALPCELWHDVMVSEPRRGTLGGGRMELSSPPSTSFMPFSIVSTFSTASWTDDPRSENMLSSRCLISLNVGRWSASKLQPGCEATLKGGG